MTRSLCFPRTVAAAGLLSLLALAPCQAGVILTPLDPVALDTSGFSISGDQTAAVRFLNELSVPVDIYWIDYGGNRVFYATIPAGSSYLQLTFLTHPWIAVQAGTGGTTVEGTGLLLAGFLPETPTAWDSGDFDIAYIRAPGAPPTVKVVMRGLDNPRGLTFGKDGALYVAEAGRGGSGPCRVVRGQNQCYGPSGAVSRLHEEVQERIVMGLASYAPQPSGAGATGPHDVSLRGRRQLYVPIGLGGPDAEAIRAFFDHDFGWLIRADEESGSWDRVADVAGYEFAANPDGGPLDSNPYGLLAGEGGRIVVDAGGNSLLRVPGNGNISTIAVFPSRAQGRVTDAVPNSVATGHDGAYYVGELTGAPFFAGIARVYRVIPGQAPQVFLDGFTAIIDLAFGCDRRTLYVLQHATGPGLSGPGALIRVAPDGTRTTVARDELTAPTSVTISCGDDGDDDDHRSADGNDGADDDDDREVIYVSNRGTSAGTGQVLRFQR